MNTNERADIDVEEQSPSALKAELEKARAELKRYRKVAQDAQVELNHRLRTGLNDILGFAELLEMQADHADRESVAQILRAGRQLLDLIDEKLKLPDDRFSVKQSVPSEAIATRCDILYVEDNDANFALVRRILQQRPEVNLLRADRGETATTVARERRPQLILLDLNLPDITGAEVLQRLRAQPETQSIPVVVISADATPSQIERLLAAGARNYLTKPISVLPFLAVVEEILTEQAALA